MSGTTNLPSSRVRWALRATILGLLLYVLLDLVAQLLPPHYSPISQAESDLAVGPYGWIMTANFVVRGLLSLSLLYALYRTLPLDSRSRAGLGLIGAWAIGAFILAASPADVSGPATVHGTIHLATAFLAFLFVAIGELLVAFAIPASPPWNAVRGTARWLAAATFVAMLVLVVGTGIPRVDSHYFGLLERLFLGFALLWMFVVSIQLLRWGGPRASGAAPTA